LDARIEIRLRLEAALRAEIELKRNIQDDAAAPPRYPRAMSFRITGLDIEPFKPLFGLDDDALASRGVLRYMADERSGFPCRITLDDALPGERVLLMNYVHQDARTPFRASHAIYVRERATEAATFIDEIPPALRSRHLSVRAFDAAGMMIDADLVTGSDLGSLAERLLAIDEAAYLHVHYAKFGCYAARIDRIEGD
jgi:hypothetical protein